MDEAQIICLNFADLRCVTLVHGHAGKYITAPLMFLN